MRSLRACVRAGAGGALLRPGAAVRSAAVAHARLSPGQDAVSPSTPADWRGAYGGGGFARSALPPWGALDARRMSAAAPSPPSEPAPSEQTQPAAAAPQEAPESEQSPTRYVGPLAVTLRRVKLLSLGSLMVTTVGAPLLVFMSAPEGVSEMAKVSLSGTVVVFGCFTTALLSYFASPYVLRLLLNSDDTATVTTMDLLARQRSVTVRLDEMREPRTMRPLATFEARGRIYFVDGNVANSDLLLRMGLQKKDITPSQPLYDSDDDEDETPTKKKR